VKQGKKLLQVSYLIVFMYHFMLRETLFKKLLTLDVLHELIEFLLFIYFL